MEWNLKTYGGVVYKGFLWFSNNTFNGLFKMNIDTGNIEFVDFFPDERQDIAAAHKKCIYCNGKLFFLPARADHICIYDIEKARFFSIRIEKNDKEFCADAVLVGKDIYIFLLDPEQDLWILDTQSLKLSRAPSFKNAYRQVIGNKDIEFLLCRGNEYKGKIYFAFYGTDMVASYDILKEKLITYHTKIENIFSCFVDHGKCWIITNHTGEIYQYDFKGEPVLIHSEGNVKNDNRRFNQIFKYKGKIWILPAYPGTIICFDEEGNKTVYDNFAGEELEHILFFGSILVKNERWILPFGLDNIYVIDENMKLDRRYSFLLRDKKSKSRILANLLEKKHEIIYEYKGFELSDFLDAVEYIKLNNERVYDSQQKGRAIFEKI